jgi:hypothetical protein
LAFVFGLSSTQGSFHHMRFRQPQAVEDVLSKPLAMDHAYLTMRNTNYSNTIVLFGNVVACEKCDLEKMAMVSPNSNVTLIINTKFAYNFELQSLPSNALLQCYLSSYKFSEHGTYLLEVISRTENGNDVCSIVKIGESSHYWLPIIVGLVIFIASIVIIQFCCHIYHHRYLDHLLANVFNQRLSNDTQESMPLINPLVSSENLRQNESNSLHSEADKSVVRVTGSEGSLPLTGLTPRPSNKTTSLTQVMPKRFRTLDTFRGFSLVVMIFVNYGGTFTFLLLVSLNWFHCV